MLCRGRQLGDPKLTLQSALLNGTRQRLLSSWLPPGGSCHDEISASRNRYFVVTDEGWRWLKVSTAVRCFVETKANAIHLTAYIYQPVATPHQAFLSTGSEVPFDKKSSFPPGEAKGQLRELVPFNVLLCSIRKWAAAPLGSPGWRPLQWLCKTMTQPHSTYDTPSASLCSAAPPEVEPRRLRRSGRLRASPTMGAKAAAPHGLHRILVYAGQIGCLTNSPRWSILAS